MTALDADDINRRFNYHEPVLMDWQADIYWVAKKAALSYQGLPDCREKSLAFTALEESMFWAVAAIAREGK